MNVFVRPETETITDRILALKKNEDFHIEYDEKEAKSVRSMISGALQYRFAPAKWKTKKVVIKGSEFLNIKRIA